MPIEKNNSNKYILKLKQAALAFFQDEDVKIILFGSRARGDNYRASDVDLGVIPYGEFDKRKITLLRGKIESLNIPYKVEVVDFSEVSAEFKKEALKGAVVWKD